MSDYELDEVQYRDKALRPLKISITVRDQSFERRSAIVFIHFVLGGELHYVRLIVSDLFSHRLNFNDVKAQIADEALKLAKRMVMTGQYKEHLSVRGDEYLDLRADDAKSSQESAVIKYVLKGKHFQFVHPDLSEVAAHEHPVVRNLLLRLLYFRGPLQAKQIVEEAHFPGDVVKDEIGILRDSPYIKVVGSKHYDSLEDVLSLTFQGREYFEKTMQATSGIVFIIAACESEDKPLQKEIIDTYKEAIRSPAGLEPRFQEHEEPHKNIYVDIFNYIDACEFVIADITYERPSCYIEIGYALAKQKQVLLFVEEDYFNDPNKMNGKVPFDLFATKYQTYRRSDLTDLKKKCAERIQVLQSRQLS